MGGSRSEQLQSIDLHNGPPACGFTPTRPSGRYGISPRLQGQIGESAGRVRGEAVQEQIFGWGEVHHSRSDPPPKHEVPDGRRRYGGFDQTEEKSPQLVAGYFQPSIMAKGHGPPKINNWVLHFF